MSRTMTIAISGYKAAKSIFERMLSALLFAPMSWLDRNPSGRLMNRLGDDQAKLDFNLPISAGSVLAVLFSFAGELLTVLGITRYLVLIFLPIFYIYYRAAVMFVTASREINRLQSISQSPIFFFKLVIEYSFIYS